MIQIYLFMMITIILIILLQWYNDKIECLHYYKISIKAYAWTHFKIRKTQVKKEKKQDKTKQKKTTVKSLLSRLDLIV